MGQIISLPDTSPPKPPPKLVLVPPLFERDIKARGRFAASSYDYLPPQKPLSWLLRDYMEGPGVSGMLALCPEADPRLTVKALVGTRGGRMSLRWQPLGAHVGHTFIELKASPLVPGDVSLHASGLHAASGLGVFTRMPLAKRISGEAAVLGVRYSSTSSSAGIILSPRDGLLQQLWLAGRSGGCTFGLRLQPLGAAPLHLLPQNMYTTSATSATTQPSAGATILPPAAAAAGTAPSPSCLDIPSSPPPSVAAAAAGGIGSGSSMVGMTGMELEEWVRRSLSLSLSYTPPAVAEARAATSGEGAERGGPFTVGVEVVGGRRLAFSFLQRLAPTRRVVNPLEDGDVVGIVNYVDVGLRLVTPLAIDPEAGAAATHTPSSPTAGGLGGSKVTRGSAPGEQGSEAPGVVLGASWQVNKNWLLKGRVGTDGAAGALGLRIWGAGISLAATASVHLSYAAPLTPRYGGTLQIENFGALMYRRAAVTGGDGSVAAGRAVLQRHEATGQETANAQGLGTMVQRSPSGQLQGAPGVLGPAQDPSSALL